MKMHLIYPRWPKLDRQTEFHLPPHGPVVFAAAVPEEAPDNDGPSVATSPDQPPDAPGGVN